MIVNMSLGGDGDSSFLHQTIKSAHDQGVVFLGAAGNQPVTTPVYPARMKKPLLSGRGMRTAELTSRPGEGLGRSLCSRQWYLYFRWRYISWRQARRIPPPWSPESRQAWRNKQRIWRKVGSPNSRSAQAEIDVIRDALLNSYGRCGSAMNNRSIGL